MGKRLQIPVGAEPLLWLQLIAGQAQLDLADAAPLPLSQGDGVGFSPAVATLTSNAHDTDVLLFAMA